MVHEFSEDNLTLIAEVLGTEPKKKRTGLSFFDS